VDTTTINAILIGAISGGVVAIIGAVGLFIRENRKSISEAQKEKMLAKKSDLTIMEQGFGVLLETYKKSLAEVSQSLTDERNARTMDKNDCQSQLDSQAREIHDLQGKLTIMLAKLPDPDSIRKMELVGAAPGVVIPVKIAPTDIDKDGNPAIPVIVKGPLPLPMTAAQVAAANEAEAESKKE
jgi:hypothetical protein